MDAKPAAQSAAAQRAVQPTLKTAKKNDVTWPDGTERGRGKRGQCALEKMKKKMKTKRKWK